MRLPTARELAVEAMSFGARPIRETSYPQRDIEVDPVKTEIHRNAAQGFEAIYRKGTGGRTVLDFYFNAQGYQAPAGELEHHFFWSSSLHPFNEHLAYGLAGAVGQLEFEPLSYRLNSAIRCYRY
jgi:hypothetical protein